MVGKKPESGNLGPRIMSASEVGSEETGTLKVTEQDGVTVLRASGGRAYPVEIPVVNEAGEVIGVYRAGTLPESKQQGPWLIDSFDLQSVMLYGETAFTRDVKR